MRTTKALLCAAAVAAGAVSAMAQSNVYSLNVVGYVNLTLTNGYNLIANQLDVDGTMTNNTLYTAIGTNVPNLTKVYAFDPTTGGYAISTFAASTQKWGGNTNPCNAALAPGKGVFVQIPAGASYPQTVTCVGNVVQGTNVVSIGTGLQILSAIPPISGGLQTVMGYAPTKLDKVYLFNPVTGGYSIRTYSGSGTTWTGGEPVPTVGQAFFLQAQAVTNWTQAFSVQ